MANIVPGLFNRAIFAGSHQLQRRNSAAEGLTQTFATILSRQMRQSGGEGGPLGIGGGASGDIYGGFIDQALGKVLAHSPAMKAINQAIERELAGPRKAHDGVTSKTGALTATFQPAVTDSGNGQNVAPLHEVKVSGMSQFGTSDFGAADNRGPLLLPPAPNPLAPGLPAPTALKG